MALVGRMKPGTTSRKPRRRPTAFSAPFFQRNIRSREGLHRQVRSLKDYVSGKLRQSLIVLWCAVGMILLIVCVNLSNLLLARAAARSKEFAMRSALGAGRGRLIRQLLTESYAFARGCGPGPGHRFPVTRYLAHQGSIALPLLASVRIDGAALGWTMLIATSRGTLRSCARA